MDKIPGVSRRKAEQRSSPVDQPAVDKRQQRLNVKVATAAGHPEYHPLSSWESEGLWNNQKEDNRIQ
jgi:hypothetical protein